MSASQKLDAWVREVVDWHFDPATGCPFWLDYAKTAGWDPRAEVKGFADFARFPEFQDEWLRETELYNVYARRSTASDQSRQCTPQTLTRVDFSAASLLRHLAARVPNYLIPSAFVLLDRLPLEFRGVSAQNCKSARHAPSRALGYRDSRRRIHASSPAECCNG